MTSPSTDNYSLGKGVVYFDKLNQTTGLYIGERDLGNAPAFAFNVSIEKLEHFSSRGGISAKDKEVISSMTPTITFTLDEINKENISLLTLGTMNSVTQAATSVSKEEVTAHPGLRSDLGKRNIGLTTLPHGTVTGGPFTVGETATGGTSSATGIVAVVGADYIQVAVTSGTFQDTETLTGGTSGATADMDSDPVWVPGAVLVQDDSDSTTYVAGTDYRVNVSLKDAKIGRIQIIDGGAISEGDVLHVTYGCAETTYTEIQAFSENQIEGQLRFVSDNPAGNQQELIAWRASLTPEGDTALIGDDWSTLGFTAEILKDESGHPDSPYFDIIME